MYINPVRNFLLFELAVAVCGQQVVIYGALDCLVQVAKLQRASLRNPAKVEVSTKYQTVDKLQQFYCFIPAKYKVGEPSVHGHYRSHVTPL